MKKQLIVIVDSGVGGFSLLPSFVNNLPFRNYIYYADSKNLPYGTKSKSKLFEITISNLNYIIKKYKPTIIVFGCNTIGTTIFEEVKKTFKNQLLFSIMPNIDENINSKTLVLATSSTINSLKSKYENNSNIILCKMNLLANKVEEYLRNGYNIVPYLKMKLAKYKCIDNVVLGCTHYYFVKKQILNILSKNVNFIDGVEILTNQIFSCSQIKENKKPKRNVLKIKVISTGEKVFVSKYKKLLNRMLKDYADLKNKIIIK